MLTLAVVVIAALTATALWLLLAPLPQMGNEGGTQRPTPAIEGVVRVVPVHAMPPDEPDDQAPSH